MQPARRELLAAGGAGIVSGCIGKFSRGIQKSGRNPVSTAPIPKKPSKYTYATMGSGNRPRIVYYGNWKCPYCAQFSTGFLKDIVTNYVKPGKVDLQYRGLAYINDQPFLGSDSPRATRAGLVVWNVDPDSYWKYHDEVMESQPSEQKRWATPEKLVSFAEQAGVDDPKIIREKLKSHQYSFAVQSTSKAATKAGVSSTPTLIIGDQKIVPINNKEKTRSLINQFVAKS